MTALIAEETRLGRPGDGSGPDLTPRDSGMLEYGCNMQAPSAEMPDSLPVHEPMDQLPHPLRFRAMPLIRWCWVDETTPAYGPLMQRLGKVLRSHRQAAGHSQESFADKIGMHRAYYSAIERGEKNLQLDTLQRVCDGLAVRMCDVLKDADA